jgi:hypothetical protein
VRKTVQRVQPCGERLEVSGMPWLDFGEEALQMLSKQAAHLKGAAGMMHWLDTSSATPFPEIPLFANPNDLDAWFTGDSNAERSPLPRHPTMEPDADSDPLRISRQACSAFRAHHHRDKTRTLRNLITKNDDIDKLLGSIALHE